MILGRSLVASKFGKEHSDHMERERTLKRPKEYGRNGFWGRLGRLFLSQVSPLRRLLRKTRLFANFTPGMASFPQGGYLYNRQLAPACGASGLPKVSWHSFRHTHATLLHEVGESLKTAQALLGHSDLETTLGVYTHAIPDAQRRAVERVARVLDPVGPKSRFENIRVERVN